MFGSEKYKNIDFMESTSKSRSVGIAHFLKHISIVIWLKSLEYQFCGRDISFSRKVNLKPTHSTVVNATMALIVICT